jgi:hypothetical protein
VVAPPNAPPSLCWSPLCSGWGGGEHREFGLKAGAQFEYRIEAWSLFGRSEAAVVSGRTPTHDPSLSGGGGFSGGLAASCEFSSSGGGGLFGRWANNSTALGWVGGAWKVGALARQDYRLFKSILVNRNHRVFFFWSIYS